MRAFHCAHVVSCFVCWLHQDGVAVCIDLDSDVHLVQNRVESNGQNGLRITATPIDDSDATEAHLGHVVIRENIIETSGKSGVSLQHAACLLISEAPHDAAVAQRA